MNTHEQYIKLETAKLAKQAGFDWSVIKYYFVEDNGATGFCEGWNGPDDWNYYKPHLGERFSAPTQSVLRRWLREEKMVHIEIITGMGLYVVWFTDCGKKRLLIENHKEATFNTYEDALEAGLQKCLTLIMKSEKLIVKS